MSQRYASEKMSTLMLVFLVMEFTSRLESGCAGRRELWTPAQGRRSAEAGGGTQWGGFVAVANMLWNCSLSWALLLASVAHSCSSTQALTTGPLWPCCTLGCSRSPSHLPGWQQHQAKLKSLDIGGQLIFKIRVKLLWNCTHRAEACFVIVNMQWMKSGPGETNFKHSAMEQGQDLS